MTASWGCPLSNVFTAISQFIIQFTANYALSEIESYVHSNFSQGRSFNLPPFLSFSASQYSVRNSRMNAFAQRILGNFEPLFLSANREGGQLRDEVAIPRFQESLLLPLCDYAQALFQRETTVLHIYGPIVIVGDIHGNLHDLLRILITMGRPPQTRYLFLGDYVDRGGFSTEVMTLLLALHCAYPSSVQLLRGNHEFSSVNSKYGFRDEVMKEYDNERIWTRFNEVFSYMPLAAIVNDELFCVHGGIGPRIKTINQIEQAPRPLTSENIPTGIRHLLWADPTETVFMFLESQSRGVEWGVGATSMFCETNKINMIVRAHQCVRDGVSSLHNDKVVTVFSSSNYDPVMANSAGVLIVDGPSSYRIRRWDPIPQKTRDEAVFYSAVELKHSASDLGDRGSIKKCFSFRGQMLRVGSSMLLQRPVSTRKWVTSSHSFTEL